MDEYTYVNYVLKYAGDGYNTLVGERLSSLSRVSSQFHLCGMVTFKTSVMYRYTQLYILQSVFFLRFSR